MIQKNPPIELRLLGRIAVRSPERDTADRVVTQPKRLALLSYLALTPGYHRRDTLLGLLWPELNTSSGRRALRQALHYLREALGEVLDARGSDEIGVDRGRLWCDAEAAARAIQAGDGGRVADLYRGDLLPGLHVSTASAEFGFWLDEQRLSLKQGAVRVLKRHAMECQEQGDAGGAVEMARRALAVEPTDERSLRLLMGVLDAAGDRAGAIQAYEEAVRRIRAEVEVEPSVETEALARRIRSRATPVEEPALVEEATPLTARSLPDYLTSMVGREGEIGAGVHLLANPDARLVTVTGPGGIGKSRLAVEIGRRSAAGYPDGVHFVPLVALTDSGRVLGEIAATLGVEAREGMLLEAVAERLAGRRALLVLDNFEHLLEAAAGVGELLARVPGVDALVASRTPLNLTIEHELPVPALSLPDPGRRLGLDLPLASEAVALFRDRAVAVDPGFRLNSGNVESVIELVLHLDGLPLAIELAAARIRQMPVQEIARRLAAGTDVLVGGARDLPDRQRTLASTIRWASDLLEEEERELFHGLSVFAGEFGVSAVQSVWPDMSSGALDALDGLDSLVDRALLQRPEWVDGEPRYLMLRTIRDHAARELERSGKADEWRRRLALHYSRWAAEGARNHLCAPTERTWLARLEREHDNIRSILDWSTGHAPAVAASIAASIHYYWYTKGMVSEGRGRIGGILSAKGHIGDEVRARLIVADGAFAGLQGNLDESIERRREGVEVYRAMGDQNRVGWALQSLGIGLRERGDLAGATAALEEALALGRKLEDRSRIMFARCTLGEIELLQGNQERAEEMLRDSLVLAGRLEERSTEARCLLALSRVAHLRAEADLAAERCEAALRMYEEDGHQIGAANASMRMGDILLAVDPSAADAHYARALANFRAIGYGIGVYQVLVALAEAMAGRGDRTRAARMLAGIAAWSESDGSSREPELGGRLRSGIAALREALEPEVFEREWSEGQTYSFERLLAMADSLVPTVELRSVAG